VVKDGRLLGWLDRSMLDGVGSVDETDPRAFSAAITDHDSLRAALDAIVTSRTNVAVVVDDDGRYLGILTLEKVTREIVS
jgi:hypothetical protein